MDKRRIAANLSKMGAAVLAAWIGYEGYTALPTIPVKGDVPTIGHGSTYYEDGTRVKMSDPAITRARAAELARHELENTFFKCVQKSLGNTLVNQTELDVATDFAGQYGCGAWQGSPMLKNLRSGNYAQSCESYEAYRFMTSRTPVAGWEPYQYVNGKATRWRFDCRTPGNKVCRGVWLRQEKRIATCKAAL